MLSKGFTNLKRKENFNNFKLQRFLNLFDRCQLCVEMIKLRGFALILDYKLVLI